MVGRWRVRRLYVCSSCEHSSAGWSGRCPACGSWGTVSEREPGEVRALRGAARAPAVLTLAGGDEEHRISTGFPGFDRVLGGGLVPGSVLLLAGAPGIGKSTLLLQLASRLTAAGHPCLVASGEEAREQVAARARRLGLPGEALRYVPGRDLHDVVGAAFGERPAVLVVDSVQTLRDPAELPAALPGGVGQVRACADTLVAVAKERGICGVIVGHVTKEGDLAGPKTLEHVVDVVASFEGDPASRAAGERARPQALPHRGRRHRAGPEAPGGAGRALRGGLGRAAAVRPRGGPGGGGGPGLGGL
ncbi:MAG TPA: ATPase domain-containing protein, partial [Actinomycetota bacterium]|nr:ATPase domain-containing protein [Actinomycetota bacterium]